MQLSNWRGYASRAVAGSRTARMGNLCLCLGVAAGFGPSLDRSEPEPRYPAVLVITRPLQARLLALADGLHSEIILCLDGAVKGDTARAFDFFMPEPQRSTHTGSAAHRCPERAVAVWHNHPTVQVITESPHQPGRRRAMPDPTLSPRALCALSGDDLETAARYGFPFMVVAVDKDTWCWWSLVQMVEFRSRGFAHAPALPGQRSWDRRAMASGS
jgi:2-polyprenyl-6-methoxyphenol hydroxylase-like FAD-dependent oxidoreductase